MYNKNKFRKVNDKKVLHKIGKHWAVLSVSLLGALGLGGFVSGHAHAANVDPQQPTPSNTQTNVPNAKTSLVANNNHLSNGLTQPSGVTSRTPQSQTGTSATPKTISRQAQNLYSQIMLSAQHNLSMHRMHPSSIGGDGSSVVPPANLTQGQKVVTGLWGTAPFSFDPNTGKLQTTSGGIISPIEDLSQNNNGPLDLQNVKSITFAPGTQAPKLLTVSDGALFGSVLDSDVTNDGPSDTIAYVSELCNLSDIDCSNLDTSNMTNMGGMFKNDTGLKHIRFGSDFNTNNVIDMSVMFYNDESLENLDLSSFNTSKVDAITSMFESDYALSDLNLGPNFDTSNVAYLSDVFHSDNSLKRLNLGNKFYVSNGIAKANDSLSDMFSHDYSLSDLDLGPHFDTSEMKNLSDMFANDSDLKTLNLGGSFDTSNATDMHGMFKGDVNLSSLNLGPHFDTTAASKQNYSKVNQGSYTASVNINYNGAQDIFANDDQLRTLIMNNARLVGPVNLPKQISTEWQQASGGKPVDLTDGEPHTGTYGLVSTDPVRETPLNLYDQSTGKPVKRVSVKGIDGTLIPWGVIDNALPTGPDNSPLYRPVIDFKNDPNVRKAFPNSVYKYGSGVINVPVEILTGWNKPQRDQYVAPTHPAPGHHVIDWNDPGPISAPSDSSSDGSSTSSSANNGTNTDTKPSTVTNNNANANTPNASNSSSVSASEAAKSASAKQSSQDRSAANSYSASVSASVSVAKSLADSASVASKNAQIEWYYSRSVSISVANANRQKASIAASQADAKIRRSLVNSVSASVAIANQKLASQAASSADAKIDASIANSYAKSADQSIADYYKTSVANSVSIANHKKALSAAQSADQSIAASAASSADAKIEASLSASVSNSVSIANASLAESAAQSADQSIANSYKTSVANSVSIANQQAASTAAEQADQAIIHSEVVTRNSDHHEIGNGDHDQSNVEPSSDQGSANNEPVSNGSSVVTSADNTSSSSSQPSASASTSSNRSNDSNNNNSSQPVASSASQSDQSDQAGTTTPINLIFNDPKTGFSESIPYNGAIGEPIEYSDAIDAFSFGHKIPGGGYTANPDPKDDKTLVKGKNELIDIDSWMDNGTVPPRYHKPSKKSSAIATPTTSASTPSISSSSASKSTSSIQTSTSSSASASSQSQNASASSKSSESDGSAVDSQSTGDDSSSRSATAPVINSVVSSTVSQSSSTAPQNSQDSVNSASASYTSAEDQMIKNSLASALNSSMASINNQNDIVNNDPEASLKSASAVQPANSVTASQSSQSSESDDVLANNIHNDEHHATPEAVPSVTEIPVTVNQFMVTTTCLAHNNMSSVGYIRDYSAVLRRHTVLTIEKAFKVQVGKHTYYRYEISLHHHHYFITGNPHFVLSKYLRPEDMKSHRHLLITKACRDSTGRQLRRGKVVKIKRIIYVHNHGRLMTRVVLANNTIITGNRNYVKLV